MKVCETFYSIQGEGPQLGMPAWFIRTAECNLRCKFCDSKYSWKKGTEVDAKTLIEWIKNSCNNVVITGGEPMIQLDFPLLIKELTKNQKNIYVETNGTIYDPMVIGFATFIVSPKLQFLNTNYIQTLRKWVDQSTFKFVIGGHGDFEAALNLCKKLKKFKDVYFMPECIKEEDQKQKLLQLIEWVKDDAPWVKVSPRLQVYLYGLRRGT